MVYPRSPVAGLATDKTRPHGHPSRASAPDARSSARRAMPLTRRYTVSHLTPDGDFAEFQRVAPATPLFEDAFSALGRGALIATTDGPVAVEDLRPGTLIQTVSGPQPVLWIGSMTVFPDGGELSARVTGREPQRMLRLSQDALGFGRPGPDLMLGPRARLLYRNGQCLDLLDSDKVFAPARAFADGINLIEVSPVSPQRVWQLCFHGQQAYVANGIEVESYHPGHQAEALLDRDMGALFFTLFPHVSGFEDFGEMQIPRLTAFELENLRAA